MAHERKCICCQKTYRYCPHCREFIGMETWHTLYCSEKCRSIYKILESYKAKKINALEAQDQLSAFDLSEKEHFHIVLKNVIEEIFSISRPKIKSRKKTKNKQEIVKPADDCE